MDRRSQPGFPELFATCSEGPPRCARRSRRFSRPQQLDPQSVLRACCIPQPIPGLSWFWRSWLHRPRVRGDQPLVRGRLFQALLLQSRAPSRAFPLHTAFRAAPVLNRRMRSRRASPFAGSPMDIDFQAPVHDPPCPLVVSRPSSASPGSTAPFGLVVGGCVPRLARPQGLAPCVDPLRPDPFPDHGRPLLSWASLSSSRRVVASRCDVFRGLRRGRCSGRRSPVRLAGASGWGSRRF